MSDPYLAEIRIFPFGFPPKGWALCNGQLLPIAQNQALFSLLGTSFGGDGKTTFALPNLQGGVALHGGTGPVGATGGESMVTLTTAQLPNHTHGVTASSNSASVSDPSNNYWATTDPTAYASSGGVALATQAITSTGNGQGHPNMSPYLVLSFCIALTGIFPPRN